MLIPDVEIVTFVQLGAKPPCFEEINNHFRVTLFPANTKIKALESWQQELKDPNATYLL